MIIKLEEINNMEFQASKLYSGEEYTLKFLFYGSNRIVIPDLQRDYCWGDKAWIEDKSVYSELVSGFLKNLVEIYQEKPKEKLTMGLIYGYEHPHTYIQLCDGQQRITTLFLILGMIYRRTSQKSIRPLLITDNEPNDDKKPNDDKEPNLQYAIRESTLYFLSDLVCNYFLNPTLETAKIKTRDWYFKEYELDASIKSMLAAINTIETILNNLEEKDIELFGDFLINNLQFIYYDMGSRERGEETFVVINTTGEPLTATENLKPLLIGENDNKVLQTKFSNEWEDREEWFWINRSKDDHTSDEGLNTFFIWYWQINLLQEQTWKNKKAYELNPKELFTNKPISRDEDEETPELKNWESSIKLDVVHGYFIALKQLIEISKNDKVASVLKSIDKKEINWSWFRKIDLDLVLPLIVYLHRFPDGKMIYQFVRRLRKNHYDKIWKERNENYIDWRHIIQIINFSDIEEDVFIYDTFASSSKFKKISNVTLNDWFNAEEQAKADLKVKYADEIMDWEDHPDFMGDLSFLFSINENSNINDLMGFFNNYKSTIDLVKSQIASNSDEKKIANMFRLFYLFIGCNKVGQMSRVNGAVQGVPFSSINRSHLFNSQFKDLVRSTDIIQYLIDFLKTNINSEYFRLSETNFTTDKAIKAFLTLKVFKAINEDTVLAFFDGNNNATGVSIFKDANSNKLVNEAPFSIENMICGFGFKSPSPYPIQYTCEDLWLKTDIIDTPFGVVEFKEEDRSVSQLLENRKEIDNIISTLFN